MSNDFLDKCRLADLYKGTQITRWSTRNYIKSENDCEHQNIVTQLVIIILSIFEVDCKTQRNALGLASIHDMFEYTEGGMGDIPHHIKEKSPEIKKIVEDHEYETILSKPIFGDAYYVYSSDKVASKIVDLADSVDVILYLEREFDLGNKNLDFTKIYYLALERVQKRYDELSNLIKEEYESK